ncbi:MAG: sigma-54-dependent Fis family transcriptional regulator [Candidatus Aureabacteria bacterium]|nr:sigma-54-dependent Fis family transcriptional regulator [Candidatus Auribacterota bacterium]
MNIQKVLVVDDEPLMREFVGETLMRMGCEVKQAQDGTSAVRMLENENYDVIFTDMKLPKLSGLEVLKKAKSTSPETEVVVMTAYGTIETAVEAMKAGACDYLLKPFTPDQVELLIKKISETLNLRAQNAYLKKEMDERLGFGEIIGQSKLLLELYETIKKVADSRASVLICGESGTGKELVARAIHYHSERKGKPFIKLNCAALPPTLIESELFGHEKGSFTGAFIQRQGRFELADSGTLFLDEISEIDISLQAKLLRVIQEREFERIGSSKSIKVDVRLLSSTNKNLKEVITQGKFREDLYYRLNVIPVMLPPLRERKGDIPLLANYFLKRFVMENKKQEKSISEEAMKSMETYAWPGNIRELQNVIERAVVMDRTGLIEKEDLGFHFEFVQKAEDTSFQAGKTLEEVEKEVILKTLKLHHNNRTQTAKSLDISIRTLRNKLNEYRRNGEIIEEEMEE